MPRTFDLIRNALPTRADKKRVCRLLGLSEGMIYRWCEDPDRSGRTNPLDATDIIMDHARQFHPDAAMAIAQHFESGNFQAISSSARNLTPQQLITSLQPGNEKECTEALHALTGALRGLLVSGSCDLKQVLDEVEEAERQLKTTSVMLRAAIKAAGSTENGQNIRQRRPTKPRK